MHTASIFILLSLIITIKNSDKDCINLSSPTLDSCAAISTGTLSKCCYATGTFTEGGTSTTKNFCILVDGTSPQNMVESMDIIKRVNSSITDINCNDNASRCKSFSGVNSFSDCNKTILDYPFSCCYVNTGPSKYCTPVISSTWNSVNDYATNLQALLNASELPVVKCSNRGLPTSKGEFIYDKFILVVWTALLLFEIL